MSANSVSSLTVATNDLVDERLQSGATIRFTVPTSSMLPTLIPGDQVIVRRVNANALHSGDIVLVQLHETWIAHRLIGKRVASGVVTLLTKGDNSADADSQCSIEELRGVVEIVEHAGRPTDFRTSQARRWGSLIAKLSRLQANWSNVRPTLFKKILLRSSGLILRAGDGLRGNKQSGKDDKAAH